MKDLIAQYKYTAAQVYGRMKELRGKLKQQDGDHLLERRCELLSQEYGDLRRTIVFLTCFQNRIEKGGDQL